MMIPSEELELKIYHFAESAGKARWRPTDLGTLSNVAQFPENAVLVDALTDLHSRAFMEFRQWSYERNDWVPYAGGTREFFHSAFGFEIRVTFSGRKYFERLEVQATETQASAVMSEIPLHGVAGTKATVQAGLHLLPQTIVTPETGNPIAFVSHATQDRPFVDKFAADLWAVGVVAWYSPWEIKPGDSIRQKIEEGFEGCEFFIFVMSKASLKRPWVQTELDIAVERRHRGKIRKIIPITIEECDDIPPIIRSICWEDFSNQDYKIALSRVLDSIFDVDVRPPLGKLTIEQKDEHST